MELEKGGLNRSQVGNRAEQSEVLKVPRVDVYSMVTERILDILSTGVVPWQSPSIARVGLPINFATGNAYRGINVFLLGCQEYRSPHFLTYRQAHELGGHVRRGEHGMPIVKLGTWKATRAQATSATAPDAESAPRRFLKIYTVFNACQIEGIEFPRPPRPPSFTESAMAAKAQGIVAEMPNPPILREGRKAHPHYVPATDTVEMPSRSSFRGEWRFYKTLFHELAHATGHASRLNRRTLTENRGMDSGEAGRKVYCQEELVAEMTAAFLGIEAGIVEDDHQNSAAYLQGWMDVLGVADHRTCLVKAAAEAQRAADYILNRHGASETSAPGDQDRPPAGEAPRGEGSPDVSTPP